MREFLERDVMAATTGAVQFHARVAINALAAVERELRDGPGDGRRASRCGSAALGFSTEAELADAIRSGDLDDRYDEVAAAVRGHGPRQAQRRQPEVPRRTRRP